MEMPIWGCSVGEKMTVKDCLYALMLQSANEVATALGEHIAGSTKKFAEMMNKRAKEAGALNTHLPTLTVYMIQTIM